MNDMGILVRQRYLDKIDKCLGKDTIVVLTGQRRVGKSYTLRLIRDLKANDETREREFGNLRNIKDNYPKYVVSMTPGVTRNDDNGIIHLHLRNFLMPENLD